MTLLNLFPFSQSIISIEDMSKRSEAFFKGADDTELFFQIWEPTQSKGALIITHGQAEHSDCYQRLAQALEELSWTIYAWDYRGHGRSQGPRGYAADFTEYIQDFVSFVDFLSRETQQQPKDFVMLGHSMGGLIQLKALLDNPQWNIKGQALSSPLLGLSVEVPFIKDLAALALSKIMPQLTLFNEISFQDLTRDADILREFEGDSLRHNRISSGVYLGSLVTMAAVHQSAGQIKCPTLLQIAENDPVTDSQASRNFYKKISSVKKTLKEYSDRKHEIYNDLGREQVYADLLQFLKSL